MEDDGKSEALSIRAWVPQDLMSSAHLLVLNRPLKQTSNSEKQRKEEEQRDPVTPSPEVHIWEPDMKLGLNRRQEVCKSR